MDGWDDEGRYFAWDFGALALLSSGWFGER